MRKSYPNREFFAADQVLCEITSAMKVDSSRRVAPSPWLDVGSAKARHLMSEPMSWERRWHRFPASDSFPWDEPAESALRKFCQYPEDRPLQLTRTCGWCGSVLWPSTEKGSSSIARVMEKLVPVVRADCLVRSRRLHSIRSSAVASSLVDE